MEIGILYIIIMAALIYLLFNPVLYIIYRMTEGGHTNEKIRD